MSEGEWEHVTIIDGEKYRNGRKLPPHGSASRYERYGCRCDECKREHNAKMQRYRDKRRQSGWKAP